MIDRTEALTVIDVNTGKSVGKTNLEETVVNTNVEAAREVARQLRLRDIGGMIVIDFIDMLLEQNKKKVIDAMKEALAQDKSRSQVFDISPLGLLEVTRKRVSGGLLEAFSETVSDLRGTGTAPHLRRQLICEPRRNVMYAVIKTGGKQHKVKPGDIIEVEYLHRRRRHRDVPAAARGRRRGQHPLGKEAEKAVVTAKLLGEQKGDKVHVFKYKNKSGYSRRQGHRQLMTLLEISDVKLGDHPEAGRGQEDGDSERSRRSRRPQSAAAAAAARGGRVAGRPLVPSTRDGTQEGRRVVPQRA